MKDVLIEVAIWLIIVASGCVVLYPYYCLANLKNIADELEKIRKIIEDKQVTE